MKLSQTEIQLMTDLLGSDIDQIKFLKTSIRKTVAAKKLIDRRMVIVADANEYYTVIPVPGRAGQFEKLKLEQSEIRDRLDSCSDMMKQYPRNAMGLVPDDVRSSQSYQENKRQLDVAFSEYREINSILVRDFPVELAIERKDRRGY